jgi:hypothetical protein
VALKNLDEILPKILLRDKAIVDGKMWYQVVATDEVSKWIRQQDESKWTYVTTVRTDRWRIYDINEELFAFVTLKWT